MSEENKKEKVEPQDSPTSGVQELTDEEKEAKAKALAEKRARAAAARAKKAEAASDEPQDSPAAEVQELTDEEKEAKAKASAEKRARAAAARAKKAEAASDEPKPPSPKQPLLDEAVRVIKEKVSPDSIESAYINEFNDHLPTLVIKNEYWTEVAQLLKNDSFFKLDYLRNVSGVDEAKHMEVVYYLVSLESAHQFCIKVKTDRDNPTIASVTPIWATANWNEREIYDLFGIDFPGHPELRRIMLSDDWVGHPLRKDYVQFDPEV